MSFSEALLVDCEIRKKGAASTPKIEVKMTFLRERSIVSMLSGVSFTGKPMAPVGHIELHV